METDFSQREFQAGVEAVATRCRVYFKDRLASVYVTGSVYTHEALAGASDLDLWGFLADSTRPEDEIWVREAERAMDSMLDVFDGVHINIRPIAYLETDRLARFMLRYNSLLYSGRDVIAELDTADAEAYRPGKAIAQKRLPFARQCLEAALRGECPPCMEKIPENTCLAARKFARYFILVEGAYFLMARDAFDSFRQESVLPLLRAHAPGHGSALDASLAVLENPLAAGMGHSAYIRQIAPLVTWMFEAIETA